MFTGYYQIMPTKRDLITPTNMASVWAKTADMIDPPNMRYRRDPVAWAEERAGLELWSKQREILRSVCDNPNTAVKSCHSAGKGLALDTPLPTPTGWTTMGDVQVGDKLLAEDGTTCHVTWTSDVRQLDCYRVTFGNGDEIVCDQDHLWNVLDRRQGAPADWRYVWDRTLTVNVREIRDHDGIPLTQPIVGQNVKLPIDPYFLGAWLGDGRQHALAIDVTLEDREIIDHCVIRTGWSVTEKIEETPGFKKFLRAVFHADRSGADVLRQLNLWKNKHIPPLYLRASIEDRIALLRGIMDTDGCVKNNRTGAVSFKSERLTRDVIELATSLGVKIALGREGIRHPRGVQIYSTFNPFHLTRKATRWEEGTTSRPARRTMVGIKSVMKTLTVPTKCIAVNSPRKLFLAGRTMLPTHNSFISAVTTCWWLDVHPHGQARVITTAPTSKQVDAVLWFEIGRLHRKLGLAGTCNLRDWFLGRQLVALGRKPPDHQQAAFQGMHAKFLLVIYDEAFGIPKNLWDEGTSLASNEYARQLAIGNPDGPGEFEDRCKPSSPWNVIHISYRHAPAFTDENVSESLMENLISRRWVDERRSDWGEDSALFVAKCEGDFPKQGDPFSVVPHHWAMRCRLNELPEDDDVVEAGIDVGAGADRTVIRERRGMRAGREEVFVDDDPMRTVGRLVEKINEWKIKKVKIDVTGIGWALHGRIRELSRKHNSTSSETTHSAEVVRVNFGERPSPGNEKKFLNRRAEIYWTVGRELSRLNLWDLTQVSDDVIHELTASRYEIMNSQGKIKIEPKNNVIKRLGGLSPDRAEALLLAFYDRGTKGSGITSAAAMMARGNLLGGVSPSDRLVGW